MTGYINIEYEVDKLKINIGMISSTLLETEIQICQ